MGTPRLFLCGGATLTSRLPKWTGAAAREVRIGKGKGEIHIDLGRLSHRLLVGVPAEAADLLEIATYVYAVDQMVRRGGPKEFEYGEKAIRDFRFEFRVRRPEIWERPDVVRTLRDVLGFLTDDAYEFGFARNPDPTPLHAFATDSLEDDAGGGWEEVVLFSGGLDSLAGAVQEVLQSERKVVLVSHRPVSKVYATQLNLAQEIATLAKSPGRKPLHVALEVNKAKRLGVEFTQRSRSFLFASLAAVVARMVGLQRVRFYENGVTSLNLPPSPQLLGGQASRTTHPRVLAGFQALFTQVLGREVSVENPFRWKTKGTILRELHASGHRDLARHSVSCAHTWERTTSHPHCGGCSQCVDRYLTLRAGGFDAAHDDPGRYKHDVMAGARVGPDMILAERIVGTAREIDRMGNATDFYLKFPELGDALPHTRLGNAEGLQACFNLYRTHCREILDVMAGEVKDCAGRYVRGGLPSNSLLAIAGVQPEPAERAVPAVSASAPRSEANTFWIDHDRFTVRLNGAVCHLGKTMEFGLFTRLARDPGAYVDVHTLAEEVWNDDQTGRNAIQQAASNLRRIFRKAGWPASVIVDGKQRGHYRLVGLENAGFLNGSAKSQR